MVKCLIQNLNLGSLTADPAFLTLMELRFLFLYNALHSYLFIVSIASIRLKRTNKVQLSGVLDKGKLFVVLTFLYLAGYF